MGEFDEELCCNLSNISESWKSLHKDRVFQLRLKEMAIIGFVHEFTYVLVDLEDYRFFAASIEWGFEYGWILVFFY